MLSKMELFIKKIISICFALVIIYLFLLNLFTTTFISTDEVVFITSKNPVSYIIVLVVFIAACILAAKYIRIQISSKLKIILKCSLCLIILLECLIWIFAGKINPVADQEFLISAARQICSNDFSAFSVGSYMYMYPHQIGLVLFECLLYVIFGENTFIIAFQVISAICIMWIWISLAHIAEYNAKDDNSLLGVYILGLGVIMLPINLYCSFVYGTVIGFAFALAAIKYELVGIEGTDIKKLLFSAVLMAIAICLKSNYSFIMLAMIVYAAYRLLSSNNNKSVIFICVFVVSLLLFNKVQGIAAKGYIEHKTGLALDEPVSYLSIIEMGLQDGREGPGWYNGYSVFTYQDAECSQARQNEIVKADLKETIKDMAAQKKAALNFFARKLASEWTNPTYEAFWISLRASSSTDRAEWVRRLMYPTNIQKIEILFSYIWIVILGGVLISTCIIKDSNTDVFIKLIFLAGFCGLMLWEAKPQYTIMYTALLIPFSINGYSTLAKTNVKAVSVKEFKNSEFAGQTMMVLSVIVITLLLMAISPYIRSCICISKDNDNWISYMGFYTAENPCIIPDGRYKISPYENENTVLSVEGENLTVIAPSEEAWFIGSKKRTSYLKYEKTGTYISAYPDGEGNYNVEAGVMFDMEGQDWRFIRVDGADNCYYIKSANNYYLSYDSENDRVYMSNNNGSYSQIWEIIDL